MMNSSKSYLELVKLRTFEERFRYLALGAIVGDRTFGNERYLNQRFYTSQAWRRARDIVIIRDDGCDLGIEGRKIEYPNPIYIHHINPLEPDDLKFGRASLTDPDNLICVTHQTHNAIHYGDESQLAKPVVERRPGDTKDW